MNKKKIMIGLSGGVDSAVTASILKSQGHDLEGVFMRNWDDDDSACQATTDLHDVEKLCDQLGIPLHTVNFSKDYMDRVFAIMLEELKQGLTPNPDILCNQEIKFDVLLKYVHKHAAQMLATGHYARITTHHGAPALTRSVDDNKDQTYFLCRMPQEALRHVLFPIGIYAKPTIRDMAQKIHIPQANKPDSTGICFIGERKFRDFISQYLLDVPGDIVDTHGERIGRHKGLFFYTIGQRKGLSIGGRKHCAEEPWFVVEKHMQENRLVVAQGDAHSSLYGDRLKAKSIHWLVDPDTLSQQMHVQAQIRHRQPLQAATVEWSGDELIATFEQPQRAITPGQSIAIYQNEICLGSAIISGSTS